MTTRCNTCFVFFKVLLYRVSPRNDEKVELWASWWRQRHLVSCRFKSDNWVFFCNTKYSTSRSLVYVTGRALTMVIFFLSRKKKRLGNDKFRGRISHSLSDQDGSCFYVKIVSTNCHIHLYNKWKGNIKTCIIMRKHDIQTF